MSELPDKLTAQINRKDPDDAAIFKLLDKGMKEEIRTEWDGKMYRLSRVLPDPDNIELTVLEFDLIEIQESSLQ